MAHSEADKTRYHESTTKDINQGGTMSLARHDTTSVEIQDNEVGKTIARNTKGGKRQRKARLKEVFESTTNLTLNLHGEKMVTTEKKDKKFNTQKKLVEN